MTPTEVFLDLRLRLNVSPLTAHQWESGQKHPSKLAAKLLSVVQKHGISVLD